MKKIIIFGTGSLAHLAYIHFTTEGEYEVIAFTVNEKYLTEKLVFDLDVVPFEQIEKTYPPDDYSMFVAVGYKKANKARSQIYDQCKAKGYDLAGCLSSKFNQMYQVKTGDNCLIMPHAIVQPYAEIGSDVIIWGGACIGYQSRIDDHSYVAPGAVIAGNVNVGKYCFIGVNSTIKDGVNIAPECVVGAGAVILRDTERGRVYRGQNAEVLPYLSSEVKYFNS